MKPRQLALILHRYIGVFVGILLIVITLTGSLLVFENEIDRFFNPHLLKVVPQKERVSLEFVLDKVSSAYPELKISSIDIPQNDTGVYKVWSESKNERTVFIYVNPYNGKILGSRLREKNLNKFPSGVTHKPAFRYNWYCSCRNLWSIPTTIMCERTNSLAWLKKLAPGFKIRWKAAWKLVNYDLHKVVGVLSVAFLLLIASTGVAMSFFTHFEKAAYALTATPLPVIPSKSEPAAGKKTLAVDRILDNAEKALPGAQTIWVNIPQNSQGLFRVGKRFSEDTSLSSASSDSQIYIDQYSGKVLRVNTVYKGP